MIDLRLFVRRGPLQAGALTFALAATAGAWAQTAATPATPSASSAAAAERAQQQSDRALYWIRVLADKPAAKPAAAPAAPKPAPAPAPAARPAPETPRVAQAPAPAPAPAPKSAPAPVATAAAEPAANLALGARTTPEPTPSAGTVATGNLAGPAASLDASPAVGGAIAAPALTAPPLDVPPPQEAPEEPDQGLVMVKSVDPEFPMNLMRRLRKGEVEVRFEVGADGQVETVSVEKSTHHGLDNAALEAVRQWRFKPGPRGHTALVDLAFNMDS